MSLPIAGGVVDASVWVSVFHSRDVHHPASAAWLQSATAAGTDLVEPAVMRVELSGALARLGGTMFAERIVASVQSQAPIRWVEVDESLWNRAQQIAARARLRGADAIYVAVAEHLRLPLVTWDREQLARASPLISVITP